MELFTKKSQCFGCMACSDACPQGAIVIESDAEGFGYPRISRELCTDCKRCKTVCPFAARAFSQTPSRYFAAQAKEPALRERSTSGAAFPVMAAAVLERGGVVYGAGFDASMRVVHQRAAGCGELERITQTKYVQSETAGIFRCVQQDLQTGKQVLFAGTPCQAEALRRFLGKKYANLVLVDLICYGVSSPGIWERYTAYLEKKHHGTLTAFQFRDKRGCDNGHTVSYKVGGREYVEKFDGNLFTSMYASNCMLRPSCHACPFTAAERGSDITLGDFWGIEKAAPEMDDGMGTSLVMLRSEQGTALWEAVREQFNHIECGRKDVLQPRLVSPTPLLPRRRLFFAIQRILPFVSAFAGIKKARSLLHGRKRA